MLYSFFFLYFSLSSFFSSHFPIRICVRFFSLGAIEIELKLQHSRYAEWSQFTVDYFSSVIWIYFPGVCNFLSHRRFIATANNDYGSSGLLLLPASRWRYDVTSNTDAAVRAMTCGFWSYGLFPWLHGLFPMYREFRSLIFGFCNVVLYTTHSTTDPRVLLLWTTNELLNATEWNKNLVFKQKIKHCLRYVCSRIANAFGLNMALCQ